MSCVRYIFAYGRWPSQPQDCPPSSVLQGNQQRTGLFHGAPCENSSCGSQQNTMKSAVTDVEEFDQHHEKIETAPILLRQLTAERMKHSSSAGGDGNIRVKGRKNTPKPRKFDVPNKQNKEQRKKIGDPVARRLSQNTKQLLNLLQEFQRETRKHRSNHRLVWSTLFQHISQRGTEIPPKQTGQRREASLNAAKETNGLS